MAQNKGEANQASDRALGEREDTKPRGTPLEASGAHPAVDVCCGFRDPLALVGRVSLLIMGIIDGHRHQGRDGGARGPPAASAA